MQILCVIVDYNKGPMVLDCVYTLLTQQADCELEINIIDNSCNVENANTLKRISNFPNVKVTINDQNVGYTKGCNQGVAETKSDYVLLLNPDIRFDWPGALASMVSLVKQDPGIAISGPRQINRNNAPADNVREFCSPFKPILRRILPEWDIFGGITGRSFLREFDYSVTQPVDWLQSSCVLVRRDFWDSIGGLDEQFYLFVSEVDLARKAWEQGYRVVYQSEAWVSADGVRTSRGNWSEVFRNWVLRQLVIDNWHYYRRHLFRQSPRWDTDVPALEPQLATSAEAKTRIKEAA